MGFVTRGLRGSGARSASRDLSSMLTPIVRMAFGAQRGVSLAIVARTAVRAAHARECGCAVHRMRYAGPRRTRGH